jgi:hypothetical protein
VTPTSELPWGQRIASGAAEALLGNSKNLVGTGWDLAKNSGRALFDTLAGDKLAEAGDALVTKLGLDDRYRALFQQTGGLAGASARTAVTPALSLVGKQFGDLSPALQVPGRPAPEPGLTRAQQVYDDTVAATGQTPSLGMVGNKWVNRIEKSLEDQALGVGAPIKERFRGASAGP